MNDISKVVNIENASVVISIRPKLVGVHVQGDELLANERHFSSMCATHQLVSLVQFFFTENVLKELPSHLISAKNWYQINTVLIEQYTMTDTTCEVLETDRCIIIKIVDLKIRIHNLTFDNKPCWDCKVSTHHNLTASVVLLKSILCGFSVHKNNLNIYLNSGQVFNLGQAIGFSFKTKGGCQMPTEHSLYEGYNMILETEAGKKMFNDLISCLTKTLNGPSDKQVGQPLALPSGMNEENGVDLLFA